MADDTSTTTATVDATADGSETDANAATAETTAEENGLPEGAKKALAAARREAREAEKARKALEAEVNGYKQRDMTEQQKLEQRATDAESRAGTAETKLNRMLAAMEAGLDAADFDLVTGTTEAEMKASASRLAERFGATAARTSFDGGPRTPATPPTDMNALIRRARGVTG